MLRAFSLLALITAVAGVCFRDADCGSQFSKCRLSSSSPNGTCDCYVLRFEADGFSSQSHADPTCTFTYCEFEPRLATALLVTSNLGAALVAVVCGLCLYRLKLAKKLDLNVATLAESSLVVGSLLLLCRDSIDFMGCQDRFSPAVFQIVYWTPQCLMLAASELILVFWLELSAGPTIAGASSAKGKRALLIILSASTALLVILVVAAALEKITVFLYAVGVCMCGAGVALIWAGARAWRTMTAVFLNNGMKARLVHFPLVSGCLCLIAGILQFMHATQLHARARDTLLLSLM